MGTVNPPFLQKAVSVISVGGGKGGIGKSTVASGIGCQLAAMGKRVVLVDADLAGPNLHLSLGVRYPTKTLNDFFSNKVSNLEELAIDTLYPDVRVIAGTTGVIDTTNPKTVQKRRLMNAIADLKTDFVVVDVGAGADEDNTDFFALSPNGIVVIANEPTSVENAYGFIKNGLVRRFVSLFDDEPSIKETVLKLANPKLGGFNRIANLISAVEREFADAAATMKEMLLNYRPRLVVNMVRNKSDVLVEENFRKIVREYLGVEMIYVGYVVYDEAVMQSVRQIKPLSLTKEARSVSCLSAITRNILQLGTLNGR